MTYANSPSFRSTSQMKNQNLQHLCHLFEVDRILVWDRFPRGFRGLNPRLLSANPGGLGGAVQPEGLADGSRSVGTEWRPPVTSPEGSGSPRRGDRGPNRFHGSI